MKTKLIIFISGIVLSFTSVSAQVELRNMGSYSIFHVGYEKYTPIALGKSPNVDYGEWFIEHWGGGLNFAKPWGSTNWGNYKLFLRDDNGFIGIGTDTPSGLLDVHGSTNPSFVLSSAANGATYFGKATNAGAWAFYTVPGDFVIKSGGGTHNIFLHMNNDNNDGNSVIGIGDGANGRTFNVFNNGKVTIGTTIFSTEAILAVNGKIECEDVEVKNISNDIVFDENYKLISLIDLEKYIKTNKHLPGVPPAEITEKGVNIGQFTNTLLQKVEELTLYMIQLQNENAELKKRVEILEK